MARSLVVFKGRKDGLTVELDAKSSFDELKKNLSREVMNSNNFFDGARLTVNFNGRRLAAEEEQELLGIIAEACNTEAVKKAPIEFKKRNMRSESPGRDKVPEIPDAMQSLAEGMSVIHKGSLRSGQSIKYPGSIIIIGNIHPGAEVIADGSIAVFGSVKGLVHAGYSGDINCFVSAIKLEPIQLRIADIISYVPQSYINKNRNKVVPTYAYVSNNDIFFVPLL